MRYRLVILLFFIYSSSFAQKGAKSVKASWNSFNKALVEKDSTRLKVLLHGSLSYGHSNAWVETKPELINDLFNGTITYNKVTTEKIDVKMIDKKLAMVRADVVIDADYKGEKGLIFHLHVLQTWKMHHMFGWQMVNRQSVGIKDK